MKRAVLVLPLVLLVFSLALSPVAGESGGVRLQVQQQPRMRIMHGYYLNWAGYSVENLSRGVPLPPGSVTYVYGQFNVPLIVECDGVVSFWVGIDGANSPTVEQTGVAALWNPYENVAYYFAWWEMYPQMPYTIGSMVIEAGDVMEASVEFDDGTQTFTFTIKDLTTGASFTTARTVHGGGPNFPLRTSAEWVVERPMMRYQGDILVLPLAEFKEPVVFDDCWAVVNGEWVGIKGMGKGTYDQMTMVDPSQKNKKPPRDALRLTSVKARGKHAFSVKWLNAGNLYSLNSESAVAFGDRISRLLWGSGSGG